LVNNSLPGEASLTALESGKPRAIHNQDISNTVKHMQSKRIVLSTFGSFGDIHPYVAIALELQDRGHQPVIATSEIYREKMETVGLEFFPVRPDMPSIDQPDEVAKVVGEVMDPKRGPEAV